MSDNKPVLAINFKGCVALNYDKDGWIPPTFFDWAVGAFKYFKLVVYSKDVEPETMETFTRNFQIPWRHTKIASGHVNAKDELHLDFVTEKPDSFLTIDDHAVTFTGRWDALFLKPEELVNFQPGIDVKELYKLPSDLGQADAAQQAARVALPPDALRKCPRHPWMTKQHDDGARSCMVTTCNWSSPAPTP